MRILAFTEHLAAPGLGGGGAESLMYDLTKAMTRRGHAVQWLQNPDIAGAVSQFRPDIVHMQTIHNRFGMGPARWLQDNHTPHIWAMMDYYQMCSGRMLLRQGDEPCAAVSGLCDGNCVWGRVNPEYPAVVNRSPVVALNAYTAEIYRRNGVRADYVVELGVDTELFSPDYAQRPTDRVNIYTSSAWADTPHKGMRYLFEAARDAYPVQLLSNMPREQVALGLKKAHIYVLPSTYEETWSLTTNEAMASGCAVIASDVAGPRAQIHEGMGVLVPPRDAKALREALDWLTRDHETREAMGKLAREHVLADHTLDAMGQRWEAVYTAVLGA
jgi:glycosyltransferase involved in cell wall biosynthesis